MSSNSALVRLAFVAVAIAFILNRLSGGYLKFYNPLPYLTALTKPAATAVAPSPSPSPTVTPNYLPTIDR